MLVHPAALQCSNAGAALLKDVVALEHFQESVQLVRPADEFKDHAVRGKIDDLCLVDAGDLPQLCAVVHVRFHLEQQQLPLQRVTSSRSVCNTSCCKAFSSLVMVTVMRLTAGSLVADTVRLSILKPRRQNRLDTRAKTPLWLSTSRLMTLR